MKLLLVEDDLQIQQYIIKGMHEVGHVIDKCADGKEGLYLATSENYDALIIDRMLPSIDGLTILKTLRSCENQVPVIILSALGDVDDRVEGLHAGSDDYLAKPFAFAELLARVVALTKRYQNSYPPEQTVLQVGDLTLNLLSRKVKRKSQTIKLQNREFLLLEYLLKHKDQIVTRTMLLEAVWNYHFDPQTSIIDVHISRLRKKIGDKDNTIIRTIRGAGYIIEDIH